MMVMVNAFEVVCNSKYTKNCTYPTVHKDDLYKYLYRHCRMQFIVWFRWCCMCEQ